MQLKTLVSVILAMISDFDIDNSQYDFDAMLWALKTIRKELDERIRSFEEYL